MRCINAAPSHSDSLRRPTSGPAVKTSVLTQVSSANLDRLSASDSDALLANARFLQRASEPRLTLLGGKKLALLCDSGEGADVLLFREAASELGAHVSLIRPRLSDAQKLKEVQHTAWLLGRRYDGTECQGLSHELVDLVRRESGIPVFGALASERHPTATRGAARRRRGA